MTARKYVLDGDYGVDDALAALYLASEPEAEIVAVGSVHGNAEAATAARNAITVLHLAGLDSVPVAVGAARPLAQPLEVSSEVHGGDGLGGAAPRPTGRERTPVAAPAALQLIKTVRTHPGQCTVVATGPLTNLALALLLAPDITSLVERVVIMGGTLARPGNVGPYTEANMAHDPEAADLVLTAPWPITLVGLDVTMDTWLEPTDLARIQTNGSERARFVWSLLQDYLDFYRRRHHRTGCPLHDPCAARIAVDPTLATYLEMPVRVELNSTINRGMLSVDRRTFLPRGINQTRVRIATGIDRDRVVDRFLAGLLGESLTD
ncbi:MAG: nucleoside hydrolase [Acidimicrobiales bacterium]